MIHPKLLDKSNRILNNIKRHNQKLLPCDIFPQLYKVIKIPFHYAECLKLIITTNCWQNIEWPIYISNKDQLSLKLSPQIIKLNQSQIEQVIILWNMYNMIENWVIKQMQIYAPNMNKLVGPNITCKLICQVGGLQQLGKMAAGNIQAMGFIKQMSQVQQCLPQYRINLIRMFSTNVAKMSKIDISKHYPQGNQGQKARIQLMQRFRKIQEEGDQSKKKPLVINDKPGKKRGGKRFRKAKKDMEIGNLHMHKNRLSFGQQEQQVQGKGLGMIGKKIGKVKLDYKHNKIKMSKQLENKLNKESRYGRLSNLEFNKSHKIQIFNPLAHIFQGKK